MAVAVGNAMIAMPAAGLQPERSARIVLRVGYRRGSHKGKMGEDLISSASHAPFLYGLNFACTIRPKSVHTPHVCAANSSCAIAAATFVAVEPSDFLPQNETVGLRLRSHRATMRGLAI
jgi:hypothetical protein